MEVFARGCFELELVSKMKIVDANKHRAMIGASL